MTKKVITYSDSVNKTEQFLVLEEVQNFTYHPESDEFDFIMKSLASVSNIKLHSSQKTKLEEFFSLNLERYTFKHGQSGTNPIFLDETVDWRPLD